jgi:hypothetical protein
VVHCRVRSDHPCADGVTSAANRTGRAHDAGWGLDAEAIPSMRAETLPTARTELALCSISETGFRHAPSLAVPGGAVY